MFAARYRLTALDPLWFRGLGPAGNSWDPSVLHATALNHALLVGLGFRQPHTAFNTLWVPHSLPYPQVGLWMSPAELEPGTAKPVGVFRGGRSGEKIQYQGGQTDPSAIHVAQDGTFASLDGRKTSVGKPFQTTGYFGSWTGVLLAEDAEALELLPEKGQKAASLVLRLGPNRVAVEMTLEPFQPVQEASDGVLADHLSDPVLLPDDLEGEVVFAKPAPLARVIANGQIGDLHVRVFKIRPETVRN